MRFLHVADPEEEKPKGDPGYHPLQKIKKFVDKSIEVWKGNFRPRKSLSADEMIAPSEARIGLSSTLRIKTMIEE